MNKKNPEVVRGLVFAAFSAAIYVVLTYAFSSLAFFPQQIRFAEALTVLPYFTPYGIAGMTVGCFISNMISPYGLLDMIVGTAASFVAAVLTYLCGKKKLKYLAPLPPVIVNAIFIGFLITIESGVFEWGSFALSALSVGIGQLIPCYAIGLPLLIVAEKRLAGKNLPGGKQ